MVSYQDNYLISTVDYTNDKVKIPKAQTIGNAADLSSLESGAGVAVHINSNSIENGELAGAVLNGAEGGYILQIEDSSDARKAIQDAYKDVYGNRKPSNLQAYEITLQEAGTSIPITGLGKQTMEITIPFPNGVGQENL
ncbi:MAG: hypothetical protein K2H40_05775, partial [Lachnospiraceae bacterium]|nr:hypothetical protein [Lachnospiraceae bacterium]